MKMIVAYLLMMLVAVVCSNSTYAYDPVTKSSKQRYNERVIGSLAEQFRAAVTYNATHANKKYYIKDNNNARFFYSHFTSDNASDLIDVDYKKTKEKHEYDWNINSYILELRDKYLPEEYKDYQIYFMVGGLFYTPDLSKTRYEERLDWKTLRSVSFQNMQATKPEIPYATDPAKEQAIRNEFSKRVNRAIYDTIVSKESINISITDKTIVIYRWLLFDFDIKDETLESYLKEYKVDWKTAKIPQPVLFMSDGFLFKTRTPEINELEKFLESDGDYSDFISLDNMTYQRNKLFKDITNTFVYFHQKDKRLIPDNICSRSDEQKDSILGMLAYSYINAPTGNWSTPFRNTVLFTNVEWDKRKCIIDHLLNKENCNDAKGMWKNNACENMLVDVIESTKGEDQKKLLNYFNDPANYNKVVDKIDDYNGDDNYTGIIYSFARLAAINGYRDQGTPNTISDALFDFYHIVKKVSDFTSQKTEFKVSVDTSSLQFTISQSQSVYTGDAMPTSPVSESTDVYNCKPFTTIYFVYSDDLGVAVQKPDGTTPIPGEIVSVPALYLQWLIDKDAKMGGIKVVNATLMVAGLIDGVSELAAATSLGAKIWESANVFFGMAGLVSGSSTFREYVKGKWGDSGMEVLATINTVGGWYGKACLGKGAFEYLQAKVRQQAFQTVLNQMRRDERWISLFSARKQEIEAAVNELGKGVVIANATDVVNSTVGDQVINTEKVELFVNIDKLGLTTLKERIKQFDDATRKKFIDNFLDVKEASLKILNADTSIVSQWNIYGTAIKNRRYPNVGHKSWQITEGTLGNSKDPVISKIFKAVERAKEPSDEEVCMAGAYSPDLQLDTVIIKYNDKAFNVDKLEVELKGYLKYLEFIREDYFNKGKLYENFYSNVPEGKVRAAGKPGIHAEVLAVNEIIRLLKKENKFHSMLDLGRIHVLIKGIPKYGNMCRCPHCFQIINGVITIGNE